MDTISRAAAIDAIRSIIAITGTFDDEILLIDKAEAQAELMKLPSAQPEIIRCKDCKHRDPEDKKCDNGVQWCAFPKRDDDFCSYAERREE